MKLGLKNNEVKIVPFSKEWHIEFIKVKEEIQQHTNIKENQIEHMGSTAIEGMTAKPIIDILVGIDDITTVDTSIIQGLEVIGFLRLKVERPSEIVIAKFTDDTYEVKTHYIHLVEYGKELWENLLFFRDYLNANENMRQDYSNLKQEYLKMYSTGINEYTDHKEPFVKNIFKKRTHD